jgi:Xaa-Pro aminopeptidase
MTKIALSEYQTRRSAILAKMQPNSVCVIGSAQLVTRSNDTEYVFRQDSYFWYLTGFDEPDSVLFLLKDAQGQTRQVISCQPKDALAEIWHGRRLGCVAAVALLGVDEALSSEALTQTFTQLFSGVDIVYSLFIQPIKSQIDECILSLKRVPKQGDLAPTQQIDCQAWLDAMRLIKSPAELALMAKVGKISAQAHCVAMQVCQPDMNEFQLEAHIQFEFAKHGARQPAYTTIVGGGENACILHYTQNNQVLNAGELVLIDAGGELEGYAGDITRTFPVNGSFTDDQAALYQIVLNAQMAAIELLQPNTLIADANHAVIEIITQGLIDLGVLTGCLADNIDNLTYRQYFMHGLGHYLGLDVHDVGAYSIGGKACPLQPGMVMTVEPGVYIAPGSPCPARFHGIGIRIEDNIVITSSGNRVLTDDVPKTIVAIEALMAQS